VHLVGFIIRIYYYARSPERQILYNSHLLVFITEEYSLLWVRSERKFFIECLHSVSGTVPGSPAQPPATRSPSSFPWSYFLALRLRRPPYDHEVRH